MLALMAEGRSNAGIARELGISERTVEAPRDRVPEARPGALTRLNRRVLAVLTLLRR